MKLCVLPLDARLEQIPAVVVAGDVHAEEDDEGDYCRYNARRMPDEPRDEDGEDCLLYTSPSPRDRG
eukprot:2114439-Rhodomonas_salina.1